jgi:pimeloyl-ACP methyl ester carboxylesterase
MIPKTRYAKSGELSIAYQVVGEGPFDVVFVPGFVSNVDHGWEMPIATLYRRLASFSRLIIFDKRGTGLSDRNCGILPLKNGSMTSARSWPRPGPRRRRFLVSLREAPWRSCLPPPIQTVREASCFMARCVNVLAGLFRLHPTISTRWSTGIGELAQELPVSRPVSWEIRASANFGLDTSEPAPAPQPSRRS